jgi:hypothetical protein
MTQTGIADARVATDRGPLLTAGLAVVWLAATLWSAHATITATAGNGAVALSAAALALPGVIISGLVAAAAVGLCTADALSRRIGSPARRVAVGAAAGLVVGLVCAGLVIAGYGTTAALLVLAGAVATTGVVGGAVGGLRPAAVVGAALAGALTWFLIGLFESAYLNRLLDLFGAGDTVASQVRARSSLAFAVAVLGGVLAGAVAFAYLRRRRDTDRRWPLYLAAGAGPGILVMLADLVTAVGGGQLIRLAGSASGADRAALTYLGSVRWETAEVILFAGALTAMLAFGVTTRRRQAG